MDLAHNEAGLEALLEIMNGVRRPGCRLLLGLGAVGDRTDDLIELLGEIGARDSDVIAIGHKKQYLRGRTTEELEALMRAGAERVGVTDVPAYDTEVDCLAALVDQAKPGDVVGLMCHAERQEAYDWIAGHGGTPDSPETLRDKVKAARGRTDPQIGPDGSVHGSALRSGHGPPSVGVMTDSLHPVPTRLDVDAAVPAFSKAMAHLDTTATRELDRVGIPRAPRPAPPARLAAQRLRLLRRHAQQGRRRERRDPAADPRRRRLGGVAVLHREGARGVRVHRVGDPAGRDARADG